MNSEIFHHYGLRAKNKIIVMHDNFVKKSITTKETLFNCANTTHFYCSEIIIQAKVFRHNLKNINRF